MVIAAHTDPDVPGKLTGYRVDLIFSNVNIIELKGIYGGGAGYIIMTFYDWGEPGSLNPAQPEPDEFGFAVLDNKDNLLYATNDFDYDRIINGERFPVLLQDLTKGNTQVHAGPTNQENKSAEIYPLVEATPIKVYPNPFSDKVAFEFTSAEDTHAVLEITNILGQKVTIKWSGREPGLTGTGKTKPHVAEGILTCNLVLKNSVDQEELSTKDKLLKQMSQLKCSCRHPCWFTFITLIARRGWLEKASLSCFYLPGWG